MSVVTDLQQDKGFDLADLLGLKPTNNLFKTRGGTKTSLGLYLTVKRFIEEAEADITRQDELTANLMFQK